MTDSFGKIDKDIKYYDKQCVKAGNLLIASIPLLWAFPPEHFDFILFVGITFYSVIYLSGIKSTKTFKHRYKESLKEFKKTDRFKALSKYQKQKCLSLAMKKIEETAFWYTFNKRPDFYFIKLILLYTMFIKTDFDNLTLLFFQLIQL